MGCGVCWGWLDEKVHVNLSASGELFSVVESCSGGLCTFGLLSVQGVVYGVGRRRVLWRVRLTVTQCWRKVEEIGLGIWDHR